MNCQKWNNLFKAGIISTTLVITPSLSITPSVSIPTITSNISMSYNQYYSTTINNSQNSYYPNNNTKKDFLNLFGETRSLTPEENKIYKRIFYKGAKKINLKAW